MDARDLAAGSMLLLMDWNASGGFHPDMGYTMTVSCGPRHRPGHP